MRYRREILSTPDGGSIALDWEAGDAASAPSTSAPHPAAADGTSNGTSKGAASASANGTSNSTSRSAAIGGDSLPASSPVLILLPGLTGGSHDSYVAFAAQRARECGIRAVVFNSRGTADSPVTSPQFYSASYTGDMRCAACRWVHACCLLTWLILICVCTECARC